MRRLLFIAYYFPPDGGAGTQRSLKFCKYLPENGWSPTVLTREARRQRGIWDPEDQSFLGELPSDVKIVRVSSNRDSSRWGGKLPGLSSSDISAAYLQAFYGAAAQLLKDRHFDAVFVTMSPFGLARVGARLHSDFGVPVVYDLRDPWALDGWREYRTKLHWLSDMRSMRQAFGTAGGVVANTPESLKAFSERFAGAVHESRMTVIPNGYDAEDFDRIAEDPKLRSDPGDFTVVHAGTLHTSNLYLRRSFFESMKKLLRFRPEPLNVMGRTELFLYRAIKMLQEEGHPAGEKFRFVCVGQNSEANLRCCREAGLEGQVHFTGYLTHAESVEWLMRADALFLPLHDLPKGYRSLIVPGKTYEYLASNRAILGALPEGDARDLVEKFSKGFTALPCDAAGIACCLRAIYRRRAELGKEPERPAWVQQYERQKLTSNLASFLNRVVGLLSEENTSHPRPCRKLIERTDSDEKDT